MTKTMGTRVLAALVLAALATACDRGGATNDQGDSDYRRAMAEYSAGRLDAARRGFVEVVRDHPGFVAARFQLACLLQDQQGDYLGAICQYRECLALAPGSDTAKVARRRLEACERLYESAVAKRLNLTDNTAVVAENARLKKEAEAAAKEIARLKAEIDKSERGRAAATAEGQRLRRLVSSIGADESTERPKVDVSDAELVDDEGAEDGVDRIKFSADVKSLVAEERDEQRATPFATTGRRAAPASRAAAPSGPPHEKRPATYVVREGDTLYKLAMRFYGHRSAWVRIRDANKAVISTDGHVKVGRQIVLPDPEL